MTGEELKQWVKEQVALELLFYKDEVLTGVLRNRPVFADVDKVVDKILSLKKPDGTPAIGIISDDQ